MRTVDAVFDYGEKMQLSHYYAWDCTNVLLGIFTSEAKALGAIEFSLRARLYQSHSEALKALEITFRAGTDLPRKFYAAVDLSKGDVFIFPTENFDQFETDWAHATEYKPGY